MSINLTEKAIKEIKRVMQDQEISVDENALEVGLAGGGCSGFSYKLGFKNKTEVDALNTTTFTFDGLEAIVDNRALPLLEGTTIDFRDSLDKRGFAFENPNSKSRCGCGNSFSA